MPGPVAGLSHAGRADFRKRQPADEMKNPAGFGRGFHLGKASSVDPFQARSAYSMVSVLTIISSSCPTKGGTMTLTPFSRIAGLKLLAAV